MQNELATINGVNNVIPIINNKIVLFQFGGPAMILTARYLSGILRMKGYETTIVSVTPTFAGVGTTWAYSEETIGDEAIRQMIELSKGALFVGIVLFTFETHLTKRFYEAFKKVSRVPVVVGGPHATLDPHHASTMSDFVCIGDGEHGIVEIAARFKDRSLSIEDITVTGEQICTNIYQSSYIKSQTGFTATAPVKESPSLADIVPTFTFDSEYNISDRGLEQVTKETAPKYIETYATFLSRGCVNNCTYCCHQRLAETSGFSRRIKSRMVKSLIDELLFIKKNYPWIKRIVFCDPNILSNAKEVKQEFIREYKQQINLPFTVTGFTFNQMTEEVLLAFLDAGLAHLTLGIQSGSEKTRVLLGRNFESLEMIKKRDELLCRLKKKHYFSVQYDIILDVPWEGQEELRESLLFVSKLRAYSYLDIFSLRLLPMTKLFFKAVDEGLINFVDKETEYKKTYRAIQCSYENFLFILLRQHLISWSVRLLVAWPLLKTLGALFKTTTGRAIFNGFISWHKTGLGKFLIRSNAALILLQRLGFYQWTKVIFTKIRTVPFRRWLGND